MKSREFDIVVVGGGCAGLFVLEAMSSLGLRTLLVERESKLASGPSIRNGAYVHAGSYHSVSLADYNRSEATVRACMTGAERLRRMFPEAVLNYGLPVHMLARDEEYAKLAIDRWENFGVEYKLKSRDELRKRYPILDVGKISLGAEVADFHVNWRIIFQKLLHSARQNGAEVVLSASLRLEDEGVIRIHEKNCDTIKIKASKIIYCTGYGTEELLRDNAHRFVSAPHIRLWRSHVLVLPPLPQVGWMFVDPGQVSVTPQIGHTLVCQAKEEELIDSAVFESCRDRLAGIASAFSDIVPNHETALASAVGHSCIKVSIGNSSEFERNVDYTISRVSDTEIIALPGKSSAAPVLADAVVQFVFSSDFGPDLAISPGTLNFPERSDEIHDS